MDFFDITDVPDDTQDINDIKEILCEEKKQELLNNYSDKHYNNAFSVQSQTYNVNLTGLPDIDKLIEKSNQLAMLYRNDYISKVTYDFENDRIISIEGTLDLNKSKVKKMR